MNYDLLSIHEKVTTVKAEASKIHARKNLEIERFGVRRFENNMVYQTSRLGSATFDRLIADTREWGGPGTKHDFGFAPAKSESRKGATVDQNVLLQFEESLKNLRESFPDFVFNGKISVNSTHTSLTSDYGLDLHTKGDVCEWYFMYQRKDSGNVLDGYFGELSATPNIEAAIKEHSKYLKVQRNEVKLQSTRMPVIFVEPLEPIEKLTESLHINKYEEGAGIYSGKLGEKLFHDKITLVDSSFDPVRGQVQFFDGEGTVRTRDELPLIEKGQFLGLISDLRFGKKYGRPSTGNGTRVYNRGVNLAPRSLRFAPGSKPWREIIKSFDRCLVAMVAAGGDSNDLGEFSTPVQIGYVFEKGEIVGRAPQLTVKTSVSDYLGKSLIDVSSDGFQPDSASACVISEMEVII